MLKSKLLAATAALIICASPAVAGGYNLNCGAPQILVGDQNDPNPVTLAVVRYSWDNRSWGVGYQFRDGGVVVRNNQYAIEDMSNERRTQWQGKLLRQPWLVMVGEIKKAVDGSYYTYNEWLYDTKQGGRLVMQSIARCNTFQPKQELPRPTADNAPSQSYAANPPQSQPNARAEVTGETRVKLHPRNGMVMVDVLIGGVNTRMLLDTGANVTTITEAVASQIVANGQGYMTGTSRAQLADGSMVTHRTMFIRELRIGPHTIRDVKAAVTSGEDMLLPFPIVSGIGPFTIDTQTSELIWRKKG